MSRRYWIIATLLTLSAWALSAWVYPTLPQRVPTHWNLQGKVDGWGDKWISTFLLPGVMIGFLILFAFLPALSPKHFEVDASRSTYLYIMMLMTALFTYLHVVILIATWQELREAPRMIDMGRALLGGIFLFFALLGNVMGKIRKNFYIGIRVPWTLASDRVWNDTHRVAAWLMVLGGAIGFMVVISGLSLYLALSVIVVTFLIPTVYSFFHYKALERRGAL
jgi:uncharacterized membrane protein